MFTDSGENGRDSGAYFTNNIRHNISINFFVLQPPTLSNLSYISEFIFDEEALVLMEQKIMSLLAFDVYAPTRYLFAMRSAQSINLSPRETCLLQYLLELSLQDMSLNIFPASAIAAAALHLTLQVSNE